MSHIGYPFVASSRNSRDVSNSISNRSTVHQLPEDLRFPLHRDTPRKSRGKIVFPYPPFKLHDIGENRETRRKLGVKS